MSDKVISFIQPSRNNLKYLKWSYNSIRKNLGYRHEICWADDFSDDGTWEWMNEIKEKDPNVKIYRNEGMFRKQGGRGNLVIKFKVIFPKTLTSSQKDIINNCLN